MYRLRSDGARPARGGQGGPLRRGPGAHGTDGRRPQAAPGPSRLEGREAGGPPQETDRADGRCAVRAPPSVRAAAAEPFRAGDAAADHPRAAAAADAAAAVRPTPGGAEEAAGAGSGEGAGVPG